MSTLRAIYLDEEAEEEEEEYEEEVWAGEEQGS
jgi:hypothetical protein